MSLEFNKVSAAILIAGIVVMVTGIVADILVEKPHELEEKAYIVEGVGEEVTAGVPAEKKELPPIAPLLADASAEKGELLTKKCAVCHSFEKGGPNKVGPNMWNIVGAQMAAKDGFAYSSALKEKGGVWDVEALNKFLYKPKQYVPGTKMVFIGLKKEKDRAHMIKYLQTLK